MAPTQEQKLELWNDLCRLAREMAEFDYIPGRFIQDLANSDPFELCWRYVFNREQPDGFTRLWSEGRLDLSVENLVYRRRTFFSAAPEILAEAERKLRAIDFDPRKQRVAR